MTTDLRDEFGALDAGDERRNERARALIGRLAEHPSRSPMQVLTSAELEGYYRFVNNQRVSLEGLLAAHASATKQRAEGLARLVIAHDTTDFRFSDETMREGLGPMDNGGQGFYAQFSLALTSRCEALGVVGVEAWTRTGVRSSKQTQREIYRDPKKESLRWMRGVRSVEKVFAGGPRLIHVMDREADDYDILCELVTGGYGFVVRSSYDRNIAESAQRLKTFARAFEVRSERAAKLSNRTKKRPEKDRKTHPPRGARTASLTFAAGEVTLKRPDKSAAEHAELRLNVVHAYEPTPPEGCEPVEWFLFTREPIETEEQILRIVDDYRARWTIEEYFKALKTGCSFEKRQHESKDALLNALGIFIPIAWSLLQLRSLSRAPEAKTQPAEEVLTLTQLQILRLESKGKLSAHPSVYEAVMLMARLFGGLQPSNGLPGWHILGHAFEKLLTLEAGWRLATEFLQRVEKTAERSDR